ncbi:MAG: phosphoribosyltransferase family protein [Planctomycetia bacterium]|nr:phosphoribosyltransferase family protein [Planctomycetia bacterium]
MTFTASFQLLRDLIRSALNLLVPERCAYCGKVRYFLQERNITRTQRGEKFHPEWSLCVECQDLFIPEERYGCRRCGQFKYQANHNSNRCPSCINKHLWFDRVIPLERYERDWRRAVFLMKKESGFLLAQTMAELMYFHRYFQLASIHADLILPVPMHPFYRWVRGTNDAEIIADRLSRLLKIRCSRRLVRCQRLTMAQRAVKMHERHQNVQGVFVPTHMPPNRTRWLGKRAMIVDDVMTTGSTVNEFARVLKKEFGFSEVTVVVLLRARGETGKTSEKSSQEIFEFSGKGSTKKGLKKYCD